MRSFVIILLFPFVSISQNFLNGDFENNGCSVDSINMTNIAFNSLMDNTSGFGFWENLDIITSATYGGGPQSGNWYVALTGGGGDRIAMELSTPLISGQGYTISFYDKADTTGNIERWELGVSQQNDTMGTIVGATAEKAVPTIWNQRMVTFVAPQSANYITLQMQPPQPGNDKPHYYNWAHVDNFSIDTCTMSLSLPPDSTMCSGQNYQINAVGTSGMYEWSTGETGTVISVSESGIYYVDLTSTCGFLRDSIVIEFADPFSFNYPSDTLMCIGDTLLIDLGSVADNLWWSTGDQLDTLVVTNAGFYEVQASNICGNLQASINVEYLDEPDIFFEYPYPFCEQSSVSVVSEDSLYWVQWSSGETTNQITPPVSGEYSVQLSNGACESEDSIQIEIIDCELLFEMPNVFTPNGDGDNDRFAPIKLKGYPEAKLVILNRWGKEIFSTTDMLLGWNGNIENDHASDGVYFWMFIGEDLFGNSIQEYGSLTLIR